MRYFIFPKSRAASLTARKKWPHIPWRKSRRNCNIVAAVYAGCFPSNILNIAVLVPKAWIASLFSAFNNGSHAKLCRGSVLPCSITLSSPPLHKICCRVFTLPLRIYNVSSSEQSIYSNTPNLRQEVSNFYMQPRFVQLDLSQLILLLPAVCKESLIKPHGFAETYSFKQPDWWNELNY